LAEGGAMGFPVSLLELRNLQPADERIGSDASRFRGLLDVPLSEERGDRVFLLTVESSAWGFIFPPNRSPADFA
jgi:hypothetical protein